MKNYSKIRGILRAKNGSQIPKLYEGNLIRGPHGMMQDGYINRLDNMLYSHLINPYNRGEIQPSSLYVPPVSTLIDNNPIGQQIQDNVQAAHNYINLNLDSKGNLNVMQSLTFADLLKQVNPNAFDTPFNLNTIPDSAKINPSFGQKAGAVFKGLGSKAKTFALNNLGMVTDVINGATDSLLGGTENSTEFNVLNKGLGWASKIKGPVGWYATAARVGLNAVNKLGARKIDAHTMSTLELSKAGNYAGMLALNSRVEADKDKSFGTFNAGGYKRANSRAVELNRLLGIWRGIQGTAEDQQAMVGNELNYLGYQMLLDGGVPTLFLRSAKQGGTLTQRINLVKSRKFKEVINVDTKQIEEFREGGKLDWEPVIELFEEWEPEIELEMFQEGGNLNLSKIKEYYKDYNLGDINFIFDEQARAEDNNLYVRNDEDAIHELWHFLSQNKPNEKYKEFYDNLNDDRITELGGNLEFVKRTGDPGDFYNPSEFEARLKAAMYMTQGEQYTKDFFKNLRSNENKYGYNMRDLLYMFNDENLEKIFNLKKGGTLGEELGTPEIEETNQKNLIPEGALHKNKHHMEHTEGLTQKGIPVIDNEGELQAEIECEEIVFTLEVTKFLEERYHKYYSDELTQKEKDLLAIEAGKELVYLILENTDDRANLIAKCEEGGKL